jgi:hypothetical protein
MIILLPILQLLGLHPVPGYRAGVREGSLCAAQASAAGLTVLELSADRTPAALAPGPDGAGGDRAPEPFGILPVLSATADRRADHARHACHDAVEDSALDELATDVCEEPAGAAAARNRALVKLRATLERERTRRHLQTLDELAALDAGRAARITRLRTAELRRATLVAAQQHLRCSTHAGTGTDRLLHRRRAP